MSLNPRVIFCGCIVIFAAAVVPARAEPVRVTAGGAFLRSNGGMHFELRSRAFQVGGDVFEDESGQAIDIQKRPTVIQPQIAEMSARWIISFGHISPDDGLDTNWTGDFRFEGPTAPCVTGDILGGDVSCAAKAPFRFSGTLTKVHFEGLQLAKHELTGAGRASASFFRLDEGPWQFQDVSYAFEDFAPVPEPGTLMLFGTGIAVVGRRAWKRRGTNLRVAD